jgi:hemolysin activation/secretion protein
LDMGVYASRSNLVLGQQFADIHARGTGSIFGFYGSQNLIKNDTVTSHFNFGYDYIDVYDFLNGSILSAADRLRVLKAGLDLDVIDDYGRTIINDDINFGIPDFMHGTKGNIDTSDVPTTRAGAGGKFFKDTLNLLRLQRLPFDSTLLWKNQFQFSSSKLTSIEQFQIGGPGSNRGYPVAETVGDQGYSMSWELAQPPYFVPKSWAMPFSSTKIYDDFRFIEFYDWSNEHLNSLQPGDEKNRTLSSLGVGARINILRNFSASYQIAWPLMGKSSDGKGVQHWIDLTVTF